MDRLPDVRLVIEWVKARWRPKLSFDRGKALFDADFYRAAYPEARTAADPYDLFLNRGWRQGRNPHPLFDTAWYLASNEDVRRAGVNPLVHYVETGAAQGRDPHPEFDARAYLATLPDPAAARSNPLLHFLDSETWVLQSHWVPSPVRRPARPGTHFRHAVALASREAATHPRAPRNGGPALAFVVPVYNTKPRYLDDLLASFRHQPQDLVELVLSDDGSTSAETRRWLKRHGSETGVTVVWNDANRGIAAATNAGIGRAGAPWVALLDHDDALAPFAADQIVRALERRPEALFLYTDEVVADKRLRPAALFTKPAWDPVLLSGVNYVNHLSVYRRDRLLAVGGLRDGFQGSQDYDLLLRYTAGLADREIVHLPYPAYLWRRDNRSYSALFLDGSTAKARRALAEHYGRDGHAAEVDDALTPDLHRVRFDRGRAAWPRVSVVIPSRDALPLITRVLDGLARLTDYPALDVTVVDNGTTDPAVLALYERAAKGSLPFRLNLRPEPFNFSRAVNRGVAAAGGEFVLLLNNDIEIRDGGWLKEMVSCFDYPGTGIVGARLLYPDGTLQHAGVITGLSDLAGHWYGGMPADFPGPQGRLLTRQSLSVVTGACFLVSKACWKTVGPFDEEVFPIAYNDVDFCLRAGRAGFRVVYTPFATLVHHESASRGSDEAPDTAVRFHRDKAALRKRHGTNAFEDRAFSPWLSRHHPGFPPVLLDRLPPER